VADIKQGNSKLRNRVIGRVFKELRYIEQWGIAEEVGLSTRAIRARMTGFAQGGLVTAVGRSERDPLRKYFWRSTQGTPKGTRKQSAS
jgi:predicted transcriptional regulator